MQHDRSPHPLRARIDRWIAGAGRADSPATGRGSLRQLTALGAALDADHATPAWWSALAEARAIDAALAAGAHVALHEPTPSGRVCDLVASRGSARVFVHVKSMTPDAAADAPPHDRASEVRHALMHALTPLEEVPRGIVVAVEALAPILAEPIALDEAEQFVRVASIGDEWLVRTRAGSIAGRVTILSPWDGAHLAFAADDAAPLGRSRERVDRLLRKACQQFMPGEPNVVVVAAPHEQALAIDWCLLGTPIERWDRFPKRGERIAFGRANDGWWSGGREPQCRMVGWLAPWPSAGRVWLRDPDRDAAADPVTALVRDLCAEQSLVQRHAQWVDGG